MLRAFSIRWWLLRCALSTPPFYHVAENPVFPNVCSRSKRLCRHGASRLQDGAVARVAPASEEGQASAGLSLAMDAGSSSGVVSSRHGGKLPPLDVHGDAGSASWERRLDGNDGAENALGPLNSLPPLPPEPADGMANRPESGLPSNSNCERTSTVWWVAEVPRQVAALMKKNLILARRNRTSTAVRTCSSLLFMLMIFLVNEGLKGRYSTLAYFQDLKDASAERAAVPGIPECQKKRGYDSCITFAYTPAPWDQYIPSDDYDSIDAFGEAVKGKGLSTCETAANGRCNDLSCQLAGLTPFHPCAKCCELYRVHRVVRTIMKNNGTAAGRSGASPISSDKVLGFISDRALDKYLLDNPEFIQGCFIFSSPHVNSTTFMVQHNSTPSQSRGSWRQPVMDETIPMQVTASRAIATEIILAVDPQGAATTSFGDMVVHLQPFAHPAQDIASFEAQIAPLFLVACAMFPFVIQISEVVSERELKLRQTLAAMGLHDTAYWLSWHMYQSAMAFVNAFLIYCFGCIFGFNIFLKNDFLVVLLTFWLHGQALVGLAFLTSTFLSRSTQAVATGFAVFLIGFVLFFMVGFFEFPFGGVDSSTGPFSYEANITTGQLQYKVDSADVLAEPLVAMLPPALLVMDINVMGKFTLAETDVGMRLNETHAYCTLQRNCDPEYSMANTWVAFIVLYILYSVLALYLDNVLPDAMGVRKPPWYFLTPSYWGLGKPNVTDAIEVVEASTDEDVLDEEARVQTRANAVVDPENAIEIRGLVAEFRRGGKPFFAVKAPWYSVRKRSLLALLGPNGAGKTTTVNMLTGFIPPSRGNALVTGQTVSHPCGMSEVRRRMGVCPQFDTLWGSLTAREHLQVRHRVKVSMKI